VPNDETNKNGGDGGNGGNGTWDGVTGEQRAVADPVFELAAVAERFKGISERLAAASKDRGFAQQYLDICDLIPEVKQRLDELRARLYDRAMASIIKQKDSTP